MSRMGKSGQRPDHIEETLHRAASSASDVPHLQYALKVYVNRCCLERDLCQSVLPKS